MTGVTGAQLSRGRWAFAFALVTSLFFTWGFAYGLLDVLNSHFQTVFGISKLQSTLLQLAYFGAYFVFSPVAGIFMNRYGYKKGIHLGLSLYSIGAIFFWPSAKFAKYGGFVGSTFVIGCGLSCLEVAANSYISVLGTQKYAAARLNFSQGFQGVATFAGPMIASKWFFQGKNATTLDTVQWVYLAVAGLGVVLNILFYFCDLPDITEDALAQEMHAAGINADHEPFRKQYHCIFGCGAQVGVAALAVNYLVEQNVGFDKSFASQMFSYCQITFAVGRFVGVVLLNFLDPALLLSFYGVACSAFALGVSYGPGSAGVGCLFALFFFESICYPVIFTLGTKNLGRHTKRGSGLVVMGVGGGAWWPPMQGAIADHNTAHSYVIPFIGYVIMTFYGVGIVMAQARKGGFRLRTFDEIEEKAAEIAPEGSVVSENVSSDLDKKRDEEFVESVA
ncbi:MFS general substrate transporter [Obba rivulosa]|uniref:MFS general substrate transporter n=1 Tax=Obba rivulosa TaxID=1052685 RepID=A0A8E2J5Q0_9APHY|nr:MFS general substrate transporter [Obba rivulosa]